MRAILIDPEKETVAEIQLGLDSYRDIQRVLACETFTTGAFLGGTIEDGFDAIYVSDDVLDERDNPRFWFQVDADRNPPSSFPIAGFGLALGTNSEGESCDLRISVGDLAKRITFTRRKFRGFKVETFDRKEGGDPLLPDIQISPVAPIIDDKSD
jgi:hypothetical protein